MRVMRMALAWGLVFGLATTAWAGGFQLQDFDAKALSMGNAFAATADNPAAVYFNPAGITQLEGLEGSASGVVIVPKTDYQAKPGHGENTDMQQGPVVVPATFGVAQLSDRIALGVGTFSPFGLGVEYENDWGGRYIVTKARLAVIEANVNVAAAFPINDMLELSLAVGGSIATGELQVKRRVDLRSFGADDAFADLSLRTNARPPARWNVAGMLLIDDGRVRLGVSYRDRIRNAHVKGRLKIAGVSDSLDALIQLNGRYRSRARTSFPAEVRTGVAYEVTEQLTVELDYRWTGWAVMKELTVDNETNKQGRTAPDTVLKLGYKNSHYVAIGAEYKLNDVISMRAGVLWDQTPVKDKFFSPLVPDNDRLGFSIGAGLQLSESTQFDIGYMGLYIFPRTKNNLQGADNALGGQPIGNGEYRTWASLIGFSIGIKL